MSFKPYNGSDDATWNIELSYCSTYESVPQIRNCIMQVKLDKYNYEHNQTIDCISILVGLVVFGIVSSSLLKKWACS